MKEYQQFIDWCVARGNEFPCTAQQFYARAVKFANSFYDGDDDLVDDLCRLGIGENYLNVLGCYQPIPNGVPQYMR